MGIAVKKGDVRQTSILLDNYLYISHLGKDLTYWRLPDCPEEIDDSMQSTFAATNALGRSAPVMTYSNSGPRSVTVTLNLHRDLMDDINEGYSNSKLQGIGEGYVENLLHAIQAIALPKYNLNNKAVEPPLIAIRFVDQIFIKGVVNGQVSVKYKKPILSNNRYAQISISFTVSEVDPYDATTVYQNGSFRGVVRTLRKGMNISED